MSWGDEKREGRAAGRGAAERHVLKAQEDLWVQALSQAAVVEAALAQTVSALCSARPDLAEEARKVEPEIDRREVAIERECLRVLALYDPVASDFRRVLTVLRVNRDLERIGDLSARIAKRVRKLARRPDPLPLPPALEDLARGALAAVHAALDALASADAATGRTVIADDRRLDQYRRAVRVGLTESIRRDPERVEDWIRLMDIARHLERIGDHAAGIAESVVYMKEGRIIRHDPPSPVDPAP